MLVILKQPKNLVVMDVFGNTMEIKQNKNTLNLKSTIEKTNNDLLDLRQIIMNIRLIWICLKKFKADFTKLTAKVEKALNNNTSSLHRPRKFDKRAVAFTVLKMDSTSSTKCQC